MGCMCSVINANFHFRRAADDKLSDAKKREMKDTLKACSLATGDDDDCTLLQCVSILQPPFVWILPKTSGILGYLKNV
uniref:Putative odorant binding protein 34a n=1 Tax=Nasonia vitripennis TaxID=7425 RepID=G8B1N9_NASVI|nr:putative odorant binding protein 34a [Nasonia vitripennis]